MTDNTDVLEGSEHPAIIDLEASGLAADSYPIEVAVWVEGKLHEWLIRPLPHWNHWDPNAERLHGLSREKLLAQGLPAQSVAMALNTVMSDSRGLVYSDAPEWDGMWLSRLFEDTSEIQQFHVVSVEDLVSPAPRSRFNEALVRIYAGGNYRRHSAGGDVCAIRDALAALGGLDTGRSNRKT